MQLTRYIQELLYQHECVTIPYFGAFLTRSFEARVSESGTFSPPCKEVNFNQLLTANDGVLAHYYAQKEAVSYEQSLRLIEKEVSSWKRRLQTQTLRFPGVGEIRLNKARRIEFVPWGKVNFNLNSFGLSSFQRSPLNKISKLNIMENSNKEDLMFTPEKNEATSKKSPVLRYAAIGLIGVALVSAAYYFSDQYVTQERILAQEKAQQQIEKNVQEATFDLGKLNAVEVNVAATSAVITPEQTYYSVIAGSFRSIDNAEKKVSQLIDEGYPAALAQANPNGLYRVAYGRYDTKKEAINMLYFLKYNLEEDAWYLEEK
ncbi:MAG: SPOR domain-containing protein [Flavobacteriaceae bacterium]|nr:SPOR domain-containing protein [Flavobacteriaceae bacterium]